MLKQFYCYLQEKPWIGATSGVGSGFLGATFHFFTNEIVLKIVSAGGIWLGFLVALVTAVAKIKQNLKPQKVYEKVNIIPGQPVEEDHGSIR